MSGVSGHGGPSPKKGEAVGRPLWSQTAPITKGACLGLLPDSEPLFLHL